MAMGAKDAGPIAERLGAPDQDWLRELLEELEQIDRPSASEGERGAAEWLVGRFAELGAEARIEAEPAHGTYWWPLGIGAALGALGGVAALRGRRLLGGAAGGALGAVGMAADFPPGKRLLRRAAAAPHHLQRRLRARPGRRRAHGRPRSPTTTPPTRASSSTPSCPNIADRLGLIERTDTSPPLMAPVIGGPILAALGALTGRRLLAKLGVLLGLGSAAAMAEIGLREVVPGANDNGTSVVALLALAKRLRRGAAGGRAGDPALDRLRGVLQRGDEGLRRAPLRRTAAREHLLPLPRVDRLAAPAGPARRGLPEDARVPAAGAGADGRPGRGARASGSSRTCACTTAPTASSRWRPGTRPPSLCGCTDLKQPANYHWPQRHRRERRLRHVADAVRLIEAAIRRLGERWL